MKKFVSILTVVAMVAALSAGAFAKDSQKAPTTPEEIIENPMNKPDNGGTTGGDTNTGDTNTGDTNTGDTNTGDTNTGNTNTGDTNTGNTNTGNTNTGDTNTGNTNTGNTTTGNEDKSDSPTAKPENYPEGSAARKIAEALSDTGNLTFADAEEQTAFFAELLGVELSELPESFTIVTNALGLANAVGVKVEKKEDGTLVVTVGQNELTKNHKAEELLALVASAKADQKGEVCAIKKDENGNLTFDTKIENGAFLIVLKTDVKEETPAA